MWDLVALLGRDLFDRMFFTFITMLIVVSAYYDLRDKNYPPSAVGLPIFGYLPMLNQKTPYTTLKDLATHYGKVFSIYLGSVYTVVISDVKLIREALNLDNFHEKTPLILANGVANGKGILMAESDRWKQHRFFLMSTLKSLSSTKGKSSRVVLEDKIQNSLSDFIQDIKESTGNACDIRPALKHSIGSLMFDVVIGMRPKKGDPNWGKLQNTIPNQLNMMSVTSSNNFVPLLRKFSKFTDAIGKLLKGKDEAAKLYENCVENFPKADSNNFQSIVEAYIAEAKRRDGKTDDSFSADQISQVLLDTLAMSWETTLDSVHWLFVYLAMYPEVQENILREMDCVLGSNREDLSLESCNKLTYTEAVIMEVWRHRPVLPMGLPHCAAERTKIGNYWISEGTLVVPLIYAVHRDQRYWEKPDDFIPERHLNDDGTIRKSEYFIPFQTGKRACIGEEFAQWTVLLFLVKMMNDFKISFPKGIKYNQEDLPDFCVTSSPPPYRLILEAR
ncbi:Cytochrome P450 18a1 [Orchesella cincta]|uniref:Cytochrome P450 18a1 n=1 Tax=Orchesella cincta TaxID=48709 RepID=A0A1D2NIJ9_ORCCI|nr:Cytochrome P450 18a1 [Orchesella cincta]